MIEDLHALGDALFRDEPPLGIDAGRAVREATAVRRTRRRLAGAGIAVVAGGTLAAVAALPPAAGNDRLSPPATSPAPVPTRLDVPAGPSAALARSYEALLRRQVELAGRSVSKVWWYTGDGQRADQRAAMYVPGVPAEISLSLDGAHGDDGWVGLVTGARSDEITMKLICGVHPDCRVSTVSPGVQRIEVDASTRPRDAGGTPGESLVALLFADGRYVAALASSEHRVESQPASPYSGLIIQGTGGVSGAGPIHAVPPALSVQQLRGLVEAAEPPVVAAAMRPQVPPSPGRTGPAMVDKNIDPKTGAVLSTTTQVLDPRDASGRQRLTTTVVDAAGRKTVTTSTVGP